MTFRIEKDSLGTIEAVSYTHLDVYKRQHYNSREREQSQLNN